MPTLVPTPGADNANTYVSGEEFGAYLDERLHAPDSVSADRAKALIMATRDVDREDFRGTPRRPRNGTAASGPTQALKWPRVGATDEVGWTFGEDVIPEVVKLATMEQAISYLSDEEDRTLPTGLEQFKRIQVDVIALEMRPGFQGHGLTDAALEFLAPVLRSRRGQIRLQRG